MTANLAARATGGGARILEKYSMKKLADHHGADANFRM